MHTYFKRNSLFTLVLFLPCKVSLKEIPVRVLLNAIAKEIHEHLNEVSDED